MNESEKIKELEQRIQCLEEQVKKLKNPKVIVEEVYRSSCSDEPADCMF